MEVKITEIVQKNLDLEVKVGFYEDGVLFGEKIYTIPLHGEINSLKPIIKADLTVISNIKSKLVALTALINQPLDLTNIH